MTIEKKLHASLGDGYNRTVYRCSESEFDAEWNRRKALEAALPPTEKREYQNISESLTYCVTHSVRSKIYPDYISLCAGPYAELDAWWCKNGLEVKARVDEAESETRRRMACRN